MNAAHVVLIREALRNGDDATVLVAELLAMKPREILAVEDLGTTVVAYVRGGGVTDVATGARHERVTTSPELDVVSDLLSRHRDALTNDDRRGVERLAALERARVTASLIERQDDGAVKAHASRVRSLLADLKVSPSWEAARALAQALHWLHVRGHGVDGGPSVRRVSRPAADRAGAA